MSYDIDARNKERKEATIRLLKHKTLGLMLGLAIVFFGLSAWSYLFVPLFLYCFMEWHDMNGYKFLACNGNTADDYSGYNDNQYRERPVENVMAYKIDNAITGGILLLVSSFFTYKMYGVHETIWLIAITLIWYFTGVKEVFFYNPLDKNFLNNKDIWWYRFTIYGFIQYKIKKSTMSGKDAVRQAFIGIAVSIALTIFQHQIYEWIIFIFNHVKGLF